MNKIFKGCCLGASLAAFVMAAGPLSAEEASAPAAEEGEAETAGPAPRTGAISEERFRKMIPTHPGYLGALAPDNLNKPRPAPPFNLTGTWFVDLREGFNKFLFGPPYPKFHEEAAQSFVEAEAAQARGETYRDSIGQCYPPGMPMIMTRVWPHAFIQLPTAVYMISGFNNAVRTIFTDGRDPSDPDLIVPTYNGESIGVWEGDSLVVTTRYFETDNHWIDRGIPISEEFQIIERIRLIEGGTVMEVEYTLTDPVNWEGEWKNTKRFVRADYTDINESHCILQYNLNLPGTDLGRAATDARGDSAASEEEEVIGE